MQRRRPGTPRSSSGRSRRRGTRRSPSRPEAQG
jgi:hypothetical protein